MARYLVIYSTTEGQTAKIAAEIRNELLRYADHTVDLFDIRELPDHFSLRNYWGVIAGASVHAMNFSPAFRDWVTRNASALNRTESAFFSVCLGILDRVNPQTRVLEETLVRDFLAESGWCPQHRAIFAGALPYSKFGFLKRHMMKAIVHRAGGDTDTSRDYEYTDWAAVRTFTDEFRAGAEVRESVERQVMR